MNVSEPLRQETSSGKAAFMTQPCLSQPRPSGPRQRPRLCLSSPVPASATEGICGWETPSAPQAPIECRTAGPNTRPWGGGPDPQTIIQQSAHRHWSTRLRLRPPNPLPGSAQGGHSFLSFIHPILQEHLPGTSPCSGHWEYDREHEE